MSPSAPSLVIAHKGAAAEVFAPTLQVLTEAQQGKALALVEASAFTITDAASLAKANDLAVVMHAHRKEIEARAEYLKRPLLDTQRAVKSIIDGVLTPLETAHKSLVGKIAAHNKKLADEAAAAQRAAEAEAEAKRKEAQRIADEEHAKKVAAEQERAAKEAAEMEAILGKPVAPEPVKVEPAPVVPVEKPAPIAPVPQASAVTTRTVPELVIDENHPALAAFKVGGEMLVTVNRAAVKRALDAGVQLPWARIEYREQVAMRGVRG